MIDLILRNATVQNGNEHIDIAIDAGVIIDSGSRLDYPARQEIDLNGRILIPGFIDPHVHLDIALMNPWSEPGRQEEFHKLSDLNEAIERRRKSFSQQDIEQRSGAALELASRHGVTHLRAQCHLDTEIGLSHIEALQRVKEAYTGRVTVQIVAFPQQGFWRNPGTLDLYREAFDIGADVMGCTSNLDYDDSGIVDFKKHIDTAFELAVELDVDLDIHADLGIPQAITLEELEIVHIARKTIESGYQGRVTAGHVCALGSALPEVAEQVIQLILEAGISVVSQPDLYRLGREDTHNTRRGLTRVKEMLAAGVNVTYASNNVRDALRPMGNLDPLEEALILSYGAHMDTIEEFNSLLKMSTYHGAKALGLQNYGLEPGCKADLVVLDAPSPSAAIVDQAEKNYVFKDGRLMASSWVKSEIFNGTQLQEVQINEVRQNDQ